MFIQVSREMPASNTTALQAVVDVDVERKKLEHLAEVLAGNDDDGLSLHCSLCLLSCCHDLRLS